MLLENEPATRSIFNVIFRRAGSEPAWVRVDDRANPKVVLCRCGWLTLYSADREAARRLVDQIPARWHVNFSATPSWVHDHVRKRRGINWVAPCFGYALKDPARLAIHHRRRRVGHLQPEDTRLVTEHWPYNEGKNDLRYISWRIRFGPTAAIRRQGRPVAWALTHGDGSMGFLHVIEPWRGQGMARTIGTALAQRLLGKGINPFLFIEKKNRASIRLTQTMGFDRVGTFVWFSACPGSKPVCRT